MHDLDTIIGAMYETVCFEPGERPDWNREREIFAPGARLVRVTDDGVFEFDLDSYETNFEAMIDSGAMPSFWEAELWRVTDQFGEMAHVLSAYESRRCRDGEFLGRGVNSMQLFRLDGRWWISAMIWRREGRDVQIAGAPR
ncbi:MAG TPA: hypothetical protein VEZ11_14240 [Thermoanaerobaculia bacterium]|nr:hypothetical protein [Thermoanaerobaculia bacterium]